MKNSFCALRARGLFVYLVLAAFAACGKAGPVMGLRPLLGPPCIPPEAPRWGFPYSIIVRGLRGFCCGSFLASLGDLPARRAMPSTAFAVRIDVDAPWAAAFTEKRVISFWSWSNDFGSILEECTSSFFRNFYTQTRPSSSEMPL